MIVLSGVSCPDTSPSRIMRAAARSLTDPPGFCHSAFAYNSTPGVSRSNLGNRTSGVFPMRSRTEEAARPDSANGEDDDDMGGCATGKVRIITNWPFAILARPMAGSAPREIQVVERGPDVLA